MKALLIRHVILLVHLTVVAMLIPGVLHWSGTIYLPYIALYLAVLLLSYSALARYLPANRSLQPPALSQRRFIQVVLGSQLVLMVVHWSWLGEVPLWEALHQTDDLVIVDIRRAAGEDVPLIVAYASHLLIKALVPLALLMAWSVDRRLFWILAVSAGLYAVSLLAKSFVVTLFVPLWIAFLITRAYLRFLILSAVFGVLVIILSTVANPQKLVRSAPGPGETEVPMDQGVHQRGFLGDAVYGVTKRLLIMPGHTVAEWFRHIPADLPYAKGGAVRPLAMVLGVPFTDYTEQIYNLVYPRMAEHHVPGTMGSASFMYGYANFGAWGLAGSGVITAAMLLLAQRIFGRRWRWAIVLNVFPLLALSSSALPTVLLTHGWGTILILFLILRPQEPPVT